MQPRNNATNIKKLSIAALNSYLGVLPYRARLRVNIIEIITQKLL